MGRIRDAYLAMSSDYINFNYGMAKTKALEMKKFWAESTKWQTNLNLLVLCLEDANYGEAKRYMKVINEMSLEDNTDHIGRFH